jgi:hypothetical protein
LKNDVEHLSHCGGPYDLTEANFGTGYNAYPGTLAEQAMIAFLGANPELAAGRRVLHVGIGNSSIFNAHGHRFAAFTGLTVGLPEKVYFEETFGRPANVEIHLANKHDPRNYGKIRGPFDLIIDANLKSYACCETHFHDMLMFYVSRLTFGGAILTAASGVGCGWPGNTPQACTPGAASDSASQEWRILGESGLRALARQYELRLEAHQLKGIPHWHGKRDTSGPPIIGDETLWMLWK